MKGLPVLKGFYDKMKEDHRVGPVHISLYMAIFHLYCLNGFENPVPVSRALLMGMAKIAGLATYHKCIRELHEFGYVKYCPSLDGRVLSSVFLMKL